MRDCTIEVLIWWFESLRVNSSRSTLQEPQSKLMEKKTNSLLAKVLTGRVKDGETIGIGSGTTVEMAVQQIGERIRQERITVFGVPTSHQIALIARDVGIRVLSSITSEVIPWAFDGADEVDDDFQLIKGRGGAMLNEKIIAKRTSKLVIIVSEEKLVDHLGKKYPIPVEVIPEAVCLVKEGLKTLGAREVNLRAAVGKYGPVITEHNNVIVDARFDEIHPKLEGQIKSLTGVVESGLFIGCTDELLIERGGKVYSRKKIEGSGRFVETLIVGGEGVDNR